MTPTDALNSLRVFVSTHRASRLTDEALAIEALSVLRAAVQEAEALRALVTALQRRDKCSLCGDNQGHHPACEQGIAVKALTSS